MGTRHGRAGRPCAHSADHSATGRFRRHLSAVGQVWRHLLPWPAESDTPSMQRVLVEAVVTADIGPLRVMTTHLEYYSPRSPLTEEVGGAFEVFPRPAQALLCGDMNFPASAPERSQILAPFAGGEPGFRDAWSILHPGEPNAPTVGIHPVDFVDRPECFDFVFITECLAGHLTAHGIDTATAASDHQPVWVDLA